MKHQIAKITTQQITTPTTFGTTAVVSIHNLFGYRRSAVIAAAAAALTCVFVVFVAFALTAVAAAHFPFSFQWFFFVQSQLCCFAVFPLNGLFVQMCVFFHAIVVFNAMSTIVVKCNNFGVVPKEKKKQLDPIKKKTWTPTTYIYHDWSKGQ